MCVGGAGVVGDTSRAPGPDCLQGVYEYPLWYSIVSASRCTSVFMYFTNIFTGREWITYA